MHRVDFDLRPLPKVFPHLDRLSQSMRLLQQQQQQVGARELWPCIKANVYGHDAGKVAQHLNKLGYMTFCVVDVA